MIKEERWSVDVHLKNEIKPTFQVIGFEDKEGAMDFLKQIKNSKSKYIITDNVIFNKENVALIRAIQVDKNGQPMEGKK